MTQKRFVITVANVGTRRRTDLLKQKPKNAAFGSQIKGVCLAAPVSPVGTPANCTFDLCEKDCDPASMDPYRLFIREGFVSLVGSGVKVPVMRDTAAFDSFILAGVLPLSEKSDTGNSVPVRGIDFNVLLVPLHKVILSCDLSQGEAELAVHPASPIPGVSVIPGNSNQILECLLRHLMDTWHLNGVF